MKINQSANPVITTPSGTGGRKTANSKSEVGSAKVSISSEAMQLHQAGQKLAAQSDVRAEKVQEGRLALANGSLDSETAIDAALDRIVADLF